MSDPHSRLGEARKQIRLVLEDVKPTSADGDLEDDVVENLEEAATLIEDVRAELLEEEDDALTSR